MRRAGFARSFMFPACTCSFCRHAVLQSQPVQETPLSFKAFPDHLPGYRGLPDPAMHESASLIKIVVETSGLRRRSVRGTHRS